MSFMEIIFYVLIILLVPLLFFIVRVINSCRKIHPFSYRPVRTPSKLPYREAYHRDGFAQSKLGDEVFDYIVIGSGIGGLASAAILARLGYKVLVLEQHDRAGGCMHVFEDHGFEFDTGIHYIGRAEKYGPRVNALVKGEIQWQKMGSEEDKFTYDSCHFGDHSDFQWCPDTWKQDLLRKFPNDKEAIEKYANTIEAFYGVPTIFWGLAKILPVFVGTILMRFVVWYWPELKMNWQELLDSWTDNIQLKQVLCGNFGDVGGLPSESSCWIPLGVQQHYHPEGGFYPVGGPEAITKGMIPVIERAGGRVLVRAPVTEIIVSKNGTALGVKVNKGGEHAIRADKAVISSIGYNLTRKLTRNKMPELPKPLNKTSVKHIMLFLGFDGSQKDLNLPTCNYWIFPGMGKGEEYGDFIASTRKEFCKEGRCLGFLGFPSAKDPDFNRRFPGKSTAVLVSEMSWELVEEWQEERCDHRSDEYQALKEKWAKHLLESCLWPRFPELKDKLTFMKVGTPLSSAHYLGKEEGESCGLLFPVERYANAHAYLRPETPITNLWLTGQDIITAGWAGAMGAAELTVGKMFGYYDLSTIVSGKSLWNDLVNLPTLKGSDFATKYETQTSSGGARTF